MGYGFEFTCKECGRKYKAILGVGMTYPHVLEEIKQKMRDGKYGAKARDLINSEPYAVVDGDRKLYVCKCGRWSVKEALDIYIPKDVEKVKKLSFGEQTAGDLGYVPFVSDYELKEYFQLALPRKHVCGKCRKEMRAIKDPEGKIMRTGLPCPRCGAKNKIDLEHTRIIMWD